MNKRKTGDNSTVGILDIIFHKYLPFWPLFAILSTASIILAFIYLRYQQPLYDISATVIISDQAKGAGDAESVRALNIYSTNKLVENEVQVLQSRMVLNDIVNNLFLYVPIFEKGKIKPAPAYATSPIVVEIKDPASIKSAKDIFFEFNAKDSTVKINNKTYTLNEWANFPFATLRFTRNPNQLAFTERPLFFNVINPKVAASGVASRLEVAAGSKLSTIVTVRYKDEVAKRGEDIVNAILANYNRLSVWNNNQLAANTLQFLDERLKNVEREIDSIENKIQQFKSSQEVTDLGEQSKIYLQIVADNTQRAADITMQLAVLDQIDWHTKQRNNRTGIIPTTLGINDPVLANLLQKLNDLELQYSNTRTSTGENHPLTKGIENELAKIRPQIVNIVQEQRSQLRAGRNTLSNTASEYSSVLRSIPRKERQLLEISRQLAIKNNIYSVLLQRQEEASLSKASTLSNSRVVDYAQASVQPVDTKKYSTIIAALIAAFILGIAYVFLTESMTSKLLFRSALEKQTSIPVIQELYLKRLEKQNTLAVHPLLSSQLQQLQTSLGMFNTLPANKVILITSGISGEGKTFLSTRFAINLASTGKKVLLIDLNLYSAESTAAFKLQSFKGYKELIENNATISEVVHNTEVSNLSVLPAGAKTENSLALLLHPGLAESLSQLKNSFDFIIIDSPPTESTSDAFVLANHVDTVLFLLRHRVSPKLVVRKIDQDPRFNNLNNVHIVFNGVKARGFLQRFYGFGYGFGYDSPISGKRYYRHA